MENQKDIIVSSTDNLQKLMLLRFFEKDNFLLFIYKKAERVASALYLISGFMSDSEPVKWQLRETATDSVSKILSLMNSTISKRETVSAVTVDFLKVSSLLDISKTAGLISEMNFNILKKELDNILETISFRYFSKNDKEVRKFLLDKEFFAVPLSQIDPSLAPESNQSDALGIKHSVHTLSDIHHLEGGIKRQNIKQEHSVRAPQKEKRGSVRKGQSSVRTGTILNLLKEKNNLTIKDFTSVIKGCSEKTIQRELSRMVSTGVLKKEGQRRWSRYYLV